MGVAVDHALIDVAGDAFRGLNADVRVCQQVRADALWAGRSESFKRSFVASS
jgi:hypothetical protein